MSIQKALGLTGIILFSTIFPQTPTPLTFNKGRIAISHDGNNWDKDDAFAFAMDFAVLAAFGIPHKLVHMEHSVIHCSDPEFYSQSLESAKGAEKFPGFDKKIVFDAWKNIDATVANFKAVAEKSTENDPLYVLLGGPAEVPYRGVAAVAKEKRQYITFISHSRANEGMGACISNSRTWSAMKRDFGPDGVKFVEIVDQNKNLGGIGHEKWNWLTTMPENSQLPKSSLAWLLERDFKGNGDISDNGMLWYLLTGNLNGKVGDYEVRFKNPLKTGVTSAFSQSFAPKAAIHTLRRGQDLQIFTGDSKIIKEIKLINLKNQIVYQSHPLQNLTLISVGTFPLGRYILQIQAGDQHLHQPIILY